MSEAPHIHGEPDYFCQYDLSETPSRFSDSLAASLGSTGLPNYFRRANPTKRRNKTLELDEVIE